MGLRERKRQRTHDAVSAAAITLFLERGYDNVSVADIAAAAEISKPTLFRYFRSKEDLVLHRIADHQGELARVVRERGDRSPLAALRDHFLDGLEQRDPVTGLNDHPEVLAYHRMVFDVPSLSARVNTYAELDEQALAIALSEGETDELMARLAAAQITAVRRVLARENWRRLSEGESATQAYASARAAAERAFTALDSGLGVEIGGSASTSRYG